MDPSNLGWLPPAIAAGLMCAFLLVLIGGWFVGQRMTQATLTKVATLFSGKIVRRGWFWSLNDEVHFQHRGVPVVFRFGKEIHRHHARPACPELAFDSGFHLDCQVWAQPTEESAQGKRPRAFDFARLRYPRDILVGEPEFDRRFVMLAHDAAGGRAFLTPTVQRVLIQLADEVISWGEGEEGLHLRVAGATLVLARRGMCLGFDQLVEFIEIGLSLLEATHRIGLNRDRKGVS